MRIERMMDEWCSLVRSSCFRGSHLLSICGPSGSGKTTIVKALSHIYPAYIENVGKNPYLRRMGSQRNGAALNQKWFLEEVGSYISKSDCVAPLVLDQDPVAIVFGYSRLFLEDSLITEEQFCGSFIKLLEIEKRLQAWECPRKVLFLDAGPELLRERVAQRDGEESMFPLDWYKRLRESFLEIANRFPNCLTLSTEKYSVQQLTETAHHLLGKHTSGCDQICGN